MDCIIGDPNLTQQIRTAFNPLKTYAIKSKLADKADD